MSLWSRLRRLAGRDALHRATRSEERLALALEAAGMAIWEMDAESGAMWWSDEAGRLFGAAGSPVTGHARLPHVVQLIHPDDRPAFQAAVAHAVARPGEVHRVQSRVVRPDGTVRWLEARGQAWLDGQGRLRGLRGSLVDVTDLKRVEEGLRRSLEEQRVIAAVAEAAARAEDEEELLARATELLGETFFPENCGFLMMDAERGLLHHARSFRSRRSPDELFPVAVGTGVVGRVAATGEARRLDDVRADPGYLALDPDMRSEICAPLKVGSRVLGVLDAESARGAAFGEADERLLSVVASHVAGAVERLRSAEALRESGELYRAYFTASPIALFVSDTRGRYLEVNGAACALTGFAREELVALSIADLLAGDDAANLGERLVGLLALGAGRNEIRIRRKDGSVRNCLVHASTIGADRLLGLLLDITDRKEAEEKLRESEERFRSLSEAAFEAILVHDGGRVVDVNQALCDLGGYSWHELVGRDGFDFLAPEHRELVYRNLLSEYASPLRDRVRAARRHADPRRGAGALVPVPGTGAAGGGGARRLGAEEGRAGPRVAHPRARGQERRARALRLHRDPRPEGAPRDPPRLRRLRREGRPGRAHRPAGQRRGADLRGGGEAPAPARRALRALAGGAPGGPAGGGSRRRPRPRGAAAGAGPGGRPGRAWRSPPTLPVVFGDRARLVRVFQALLDNALKFAGPEPVVVVDSRPPLEGKAVVVVRDNGIGIEARHRDRVFGLFEKLDPRAEGSGVGLAVVKRIVESLGGRAWLESEGKGKGTAACVELPLAAVPAARPAPTEEAERLLG